MGRIVNAAVVGLLIALWSGAVWAAQALVRWMLAGAGGWSDGPGVGFAGDALAALAPWLPPPLIPFMQTVLDGVAPFIQGLLHVMPALLPILTAAAWLVWALGVVGLLGLGLVLHGMLGWRRPGWRPGDWGPVRSLLLQAVWRR